MGEETTPLLTVDNLTIEIAGANVVDGVSFTVARGEVLALVGESGCGKSLTSYAMLGLLPPAARRIAGRILLEGTDLAAMSERQLRKARGKDISIIFQEPSASLDPLTTVGSQIASAFRQHHAVSGTEAFARARDMLVAVGIPDADHRLHQYPFELSGGMCQRIMIAIALICGPRVLVADEPTTALDVTIQAQILDLMKQLVATSGTSIVFITHDMGVVADIADHVAVMYAGRIAEIAPVRDLFARPAHPYTALLLASVPRLDITPKANLATIEGSVPFPNEFGYGCRFASRCPLATDRCRAEQPPLFEQGGGHRSACWHINRVHELKENAA
ncbi:peptide/nickel transport system ATP-binding protein [Phyllobacterium trifolii]|uniref:Peptide/nickel transport system ATP-binding protein n=1 Tax=Phyllobacterium trifolii TaxID=300193 RepID=A0A839UFI3_9HYPH|nr:ABC transporter ATP-binding protein [Phyllobacterium trifolii]MBB3148553.1 peptide/nickel transport system ATP-binding protein [Phyllobacterium trifolii]